MSLYRITARKGRTYVGKSETGFSKFDALVAFLKREYDMDVVVEKMIQTGPKKL